MRPNNYPPDKVTDAASEDYPDTYAQYTHDYTTQNWDDPNGSELRRVIAVPLVNCTGQDNGSTELPLVAIGCFFLSAPVKPGENEQDIYGEYLSTRQIAGSVKVESTGVM